MIFCQFKLRLMRFESVCDACALPTMNNEELGSLFSSARRFSHLSGPCELGGGHVQDLTMADRTASLMTSDHRGDPFRTEMNGFSGDLQMVSLIPAIKAKIPPLCNLFNIT